MFGVYFGEYLQNKGILTKEKYIEIMNEMKTARVKMGLLAVEEGLITVKQTDEINRLQTIKDKRFGDLAVEEGYLTEEQVCKLLKKQGNAYLLFVQGITEKGILNLDELHKELNAYMEDEGLTESELEDIKSSDIDRIVPLFTKDPGISQFIKEYTALLARNIVRFIDNNVMMKKAELITEYEGRYLSRQDLNGKYDILTAFSGSGEGMIETAEKYAKEKFDIVDEDVLDAVCEFLNCNNGLYASKLSEEEVELDMLPPLMYMDKVKIKASKGMVKIPFYVSEKCLNMIICVGSGYGVEG